MNSLRNEDSLVAVEAIDFAKTIACHFASLLRVGEKTSRREIQKTSGKKNHKPPVCVCITVLRMLFSPNPFPVLFDLFLFLQAEVTLAVSSAFYWLCIT